MSRYESLDWRLREAWPESRETKKRTEWGVLHPEDSRVWLTHTTERGARDQVKRHPEVTLVKRVVEVEIIETAGDWQATI